MKVISSASEMKMISGDARARRQKIVFVPTMGALHEGHLALLREGRRRGDVLVVSIFVNPTQFNSREDFEKYPHHLPSDLKKCEGEKVDIVFAPTVEEIYPEGMKVTGIYLPAVTKPLEGAARPGHFAGVLQIVSKLFRVVQPNEAIFGMKDYQQLRVIQEMVKKEGFEVDIIPCPTVRTPEGLAMSSRNERLSPSGLQKASQISKALQTAQALFQRGERDPENIQKEVTQKILEEPALKIDYVAVVDAQTLEEISQVKDSALVAIAVLIEGIRLIDNCILEAGGVKKHTL